MTQLTTVEIPDRRRRAILALDRAGIHALQDTMARRARGKSPRVVIAGAELDAKFVLVERLRVLGECWRLTFVGPNGAKRVVAGSAASVRQDLGRRQEFLEVAGLAHPLAAHHGAAIEEGEFVLAAIEEGEQLERHGGQGAEQ